MGLKKIGFVSPTRRGNADYRPRQRRARVSDRLGRAVKFNGIPHHFRKGFARILAQLLQPDEIPILFCGHNIIYIRPLQRLTAFGSVLLWMIFNFTILAKSSFHPQQNGTKGGIIIALAGVIVTLLQRGGG